VAALTEWTNDFIGRGVAASRPAAGIKGRLYIATDTNAISRDNGTSWDAITVGSSLTVKDEGGALTTDATTLDFVGSGVTASGTGATKTITIPGATGLTVKDEGGALTTDATTLDFVGAGVVASGTGATKTITIAGATSGVTVAEVDGSPSTAGITTLVFPNDAVTIASTTATIREVPQGFIGVKAYNVGTQNVANATVVAVALGAEEYDSDGFHDNSTNNSRLTIPVGLGGKYLLAGGTTYDTDTTGVRYGWWRKNGTTDLRGEVAYAPIAAGISVQHVTPVDLVAGDYVEFVTYQDSGGTRTVGHASGAAAMNWASITKLDSGKVGGGIGASVYASANQSVTDTFILYDSELFDTDGFHSTSSQTQRFTIPAGLGGKYIVVGGGQMSTAGAIRIFKTGNSAGPGQHAGANESANLSLILDLAAGDYVDLRTSTGGATTVNGGDPTGSSSRTTFSIMRLDSGAGAVRAGEMIGLKAYDPTATDTTISATSQSDVDATNLIVTFTAPSSGNVLVRLTCSCYAEAAGAVLRWGLREGSTDVAGPSIVLGDGPTGPWIVVSKAFYITGLAAGSHTYKWAASRVTANCNMRYGTLYGQAVMEVIAL
jgi:hypothetical protein